MTKIEGKQLILRDMTLADLSPLRDWMHPDQQWHNTDGPYYPKSTEEEIEAIISTWEQSITADDWPDLRQRLIVADAANDSVIGMVTRYWISKETNWTAIGIAIYDPGNWGKGYGYQALGLWCQYLFNREPTFVRLDLRTWSGNFGMVRLAEKLGFRQEAVFRMARIVEGEYYDGLGYGILRSEWKDRYPQGFAAAL